MNLSVSVGMIDLLIVLINAGFAFTQLTPLFPKRMVFAAMYGIGVAVTIKAVTFCVMADFILTQAMGAAR